MLIFQTVLAASSNSLVSSLDLPSSDTAVNPASAAIATSPNRRMSFITVTSGRGPCRFTKPSIVQRLDPRIDAKISSQYQVANEWDLAGLTDVSGNLGRPLQSNVLAVPARVELERDRLLWSWGHGDKGPTETRATPELLTEFAALPDASDERILRFARRWGVLSICEHGLPASHNPGRLGDHHGGCRPLGWTESSPWWDGWEPLDSWRHFAGQARGLINIAAQVHVEKPGSDADWAIVFRRGARKDAPWWHRTVIADRLMLTQVVNEWLELGRVVPYARWHEPAPQILLVAPGLFGALAGQLLLASVNTRGLAVCSRCGQGYSCR